MDKHAHFMTPAQSLNHLKIALVAAAILATLGAGWTVVSTVHATTQVVRPSCSMRLAHSTVSVELAGGDAKSICAKTSARGVLVAGPVAGNVVCSLTRDGVEAIVHDSEADGAEGHLYCAFLAELKTFK